MIHRLVPCATSALYNSLQQPSHCMIPDSWPNRKLLALYNEHHLADYENDH